MITFQFENVDDVIDEIKPLLERHWQEIALNKDKISFDPDYQQYFNLEKLGMLQVCTARDDDKLIGYTVDFILKHAHYQQNKFAMNDILFIAPEYRKGTIAFKLLSKAKEGLKERGVDVHNLHMKVDHPFEALAERLDYTKIEYIYSSYLGD